MPPTVRTVVSTILKPNGTAWADGRVIFTLVPGSYIPGDQFPTSTVTVHADETGAMTVELWCNEEGEENSVYACQLPSGESFEFTLPASATDPVELTLLRAAGVTPAMPQYASILDYINTDPRFVGPAGPGLPSTAGHDPGDMIQISDGGVAEWVYPGELSRFFSTLDHTHTFASITGKPTTLAGYGIADAYTKAQADAQYAAIAHTHTFASLTSKPTTIAGYGITDAFTKTEADARYAALVHTHSAADITSGTLAGALFPATLPAASGLNLTALNATNLGSGTVADARLSANVALRDAANVFTSTGTHAFSGIIQVRRALGADFFQLADSGASNAVRGKESIVASTSDWVFYTATGAVGSEVYTEALRFINATAYVKVPLRLGVNVTPTVPLHAVGSVTFSGSGASEQLYVQYAPTVATASAIDFAVNFTTAIGLRVTQLQATATVPVFVVKHGATPGAGGYGLSVITSASANILGTTDKLSVLVGSAALATSATDGFLYIPSGAGAPSGVPTSFTGRVPLYIDSTGKFLYLYLGGWVKTTVFA